MEEKIVQKIGNHSLNLKDNHLFISGVVKVKNVNENGFACILNGRGFVASGSGIHMLRLDVEKGEVELEGNFSALKYTAGGNAKQNFMKRIFG